MTCSRTASGLSVLARSRDPDLVASTVAKVLDVREASGQRIPERLRAELRQKRVLLLLDNFEQVVTVAPFVAELLGACPGSTILVTSRMRLRVSGEHEYVVAPLRLVELDGHLSLEAVQAQTPYGSSSSAHGRFGRTLPSRQRMPPPSPSSAPGWTDCRSPSSWQPPGSRCSPRGSCWRAWSGDYRS